jgi:hypothetical protein
MKPRSYLLFHGLLKIGVVTEDDADFPNMFGAIAYEPWILEPRDPDEKRLARFVELNCESTRLVDLEDEVDTSAESEKIDAELGQYQDLVESEEWWLVDDVGKKVPILCPMLRTSEIVWRWDPGREAP